MDWCKFHSTDFLAGHGLSFSLYEDKVVWIQKIDDFSSKLTYSNLNTYDPVLLVENSANPIYQTEIYNNIVIWKEGIETKVCDLSGYDGGSTWCRDASSGLMSIPPQDVRDLYHFSIDSNYLILEYIEHFFPGNSVYICDISHYQENSDTIMYNPHLCQNEETGLVRLFGTPFSFVYPLLYNPVLDNNNLFYSKRVDGLMNIYTCDLSGFDGSEDWCDSDDVNSLYLEDFGYNAFDIDNGRVFYGI